MQAKNKLTEQISLCFECILLKVSGMIFIIHTTMIKKKVILLFWIALTVTAPHPPAPHPSRFFDHCILTDRALKLILYGFFSIMDHVTSKFFFDQSNNLPTPACLSMTVNNCRLLWNCRFIATPPQFQKLDVNLVI